MVKNTNKGKTFTRNPELISLPTEMICTEPESFFVYRTISQDERDFGKIPIFHKTSLTVESVTNNFKYWTTKNGKKTMITPLLKKALLVLFERCCIPHGRFLKERA